MWMILNQFVKILGSKKSSLMDLMVKCVLNSQKKKKQNGKNVKISYQKIKMKSLEKSREFIAKLKNMLILKNWTLML